MTRRKLHQGASVILAESPIINQPTQKITHAMKNDTHRLADEVFLTKSELSGIEDSPVSMLIVRLQRLHYCLKCADPIGESTVNSL
jgi:hypothetical protein